VRGKLRLAKTAAMKPEWQNARWAMVLALNTHMPACEPLPAKCSASASGLSPKRGLRNRDDVGETVRESRPCSKRALHSKAVQRGA